MKLTDLGATDASKKATAKLSHQVHKSTVAAGKQPRLTLDTVGFSIGQTQSTGLTSRVNEEELSPAAVLQLLMNLDHMAREDEELAFGLRFDYKFGKEMAFNKLAAVSEALRIAKIGLTDSNKSGRMLRALQGATMLTHDGNLKRMAEYTDTIEKEGFVFEPHVMEAFKSAKLLWTQADELEAYTSGVNKIVDFLFELEHVEPHLPSYKFINAALKKLGLR
jgi:hypothetical protein